MAGAEKYGGKFFGVEDTNGNVIMFNAERIEIVAGALVCVGAFRAKSGDPPGEPMPYLAWAAGSWSHCWAASVFDGEPVAINSVHRAKKAPTKRVVNR